MDNGDFFKNHNTELSAFLVKSKRQKKEDTLRKINVGASFYDAIESKHGKTLLKAYADIIDFEFDKIINYKHIDKLGVEGNYYNLLAYIASYKAVKDTGDVWAGKIQNLAEGMKEVRKTNLEREESDVR